MVVAWLGTLDGWWPVALESPASTCLHVHPFCPGQMMKDLLLEFHKVTRGRKPEVRGRRPAGMAQPGVVLVHVLQGALAVLFQGCTATAALCCGI